MMGSAVRNGRSSIHSWIGLPRPLRGGRQLPDQLDSALVAVDIVHHSAGDEVLGLDKRGRTQAVSASPLFRRSA